MKKVIMTGLLFLFGCGCLSFPSASDYKDRPKPCYEYAKCLYYNQKNPDKASCVKFGETCLKMDVYTFCEIKAKDNIDDIKYFQSCWDKLN